MDMNFDFYQGSCGSFRFEEEEIVLLCFSYPGDEKYKCRSFNGTTFTDSNSSSTHGHTKAGNALGKYNGKPFVTGGYDGQYHAETEILDLNNTAEKYIWNLHKKYPFSESIRYAATVSFQDRVVVIGGDYIDLIAEFKNEIWTILTNLSTVRSYHNAIVADHDVVIVGGVGEL